VLVNNAGANVFGGVLDTDVATWNRCLDLDLRAVWLCSRAAARVMDGGAIVNVASNHAFATLPGVFPYNVAKAAVLALTQSLAIELAPIRVNAVCPGYIDTPINDAYFDGFADPAAERARVEELHPLRRIGRPQEVARAIRFLAHDGFTTGTTLTIDGGRSALMQDPPGGETHGK
jgi:NAD(P)-dependent dehydrogenase (short-subunit alcohol dehydrogenase family)